MDILYYFDAYAKEFEAEVLEVNGKYIVLDKTAFYAAGGGQPYDTGKIISDNEYNVVSVGKVDGKISHEVDKDKIGEYTKEANEIINRNLEVKSYFISKEEAAEIEGLTKLAMKLPEREKIRIVEIGDFDKQADGGTHVRNTKEIGK